MDEYKPAFRKVFDFMEKHLNAETDDDFQKLADDAGKFIESFEVDMMVAVTNEIDRRYQTLKEGCGE